MVELLLSHIYIELIIVILFINVYFMYYIIRQIRKLKLKLFNN